jgi:uncharacterized protein
MNLYCDASALAKLYAEEAHSAAVRQWADDAEMTATSEVAYLEVVCGLSRRGREGSMTNGDVRAAISQWSEDWTSLVHLPVATQEGEGLVLRHPLQALDAIHVAAALALRQAMPEAAVAFASFDARQVAAARAEGLAVLEPPAVIVGQAASEP